MEKRVAIITTHPIQYNAPLFQLLAQQQGLVIKVFYTWGAQAATAKYDPGFGSTVAWDIPLLSGYEYEFVDNVSTNPGSHHFKGIDNPSLVKMVMAWQPTAVLVYGWSFKSHLQLMRYCKGKLPVLFRGDSTLLIPSSVIKKIIRQLFLRWVYHYVDIALYPGKANQAYLSTAGVALHKQVFMPHAVDNQRFFANETLLQAAAHLKATLHIPANAKVVLFVGKLDAHKQIDTILRTFNDVHTTNTYFLVVGSGALFTSIKNLYTDHPYIIFTGFVNQLQMPSYYHVADVLILHSISETWGLAINEAMAAGKAIITNLNCGAAYDLVQDGVNGFIIKNNADLKEVFKTIDVSTTLLQQMGAASLKIIAPYSYEQGCNTLVKTVQKL